MLGAWRAEPNGGVAAWLRHVGGVAGRGVASRACPRDSYALCSKDEDGRAHHDTDEHQEEGSAHDEAERREDGRAHEKDREVQLGERDLVGRSGLGRLGDRDRDQLALRLGA